MCCVIKERRSMARFHRQKFFVSVVSAVAILQAMLNCCVAAESDGETPATLSHWHRTGSGPLCGVYAATNALAMIGCDASAEDFVATKYVGARQGSSPTEVAAIVEDAGADAHIFKGLSNLELKLLAYPLIANVRSTPTSRAFDHWVLAVADAGDILIYDGVAPQARISVAEFLGMWNGVGIIVSPRGSYPLQSLWAGRAAVLQVGLLAVLVLHSAFSPILKKAQPSFSRQTLAVGLTTVGLALIGQMVFGDISSHFQGVTVASAPFQTPRFTHGTLADARRASETPGHLLIDARYEQDFRAGSIPNAVNIPVYASVWSIRESLRDVDRQSPVAVFCQSKACAYGEVVARNLNLLGFEQVVVCDEGWREYSSQGD